MECSWTGQQLDAKWTCDITPSFLPAFPSVLLSSRCLQVSRTDGETSDQTLLVPWMWIVEGGPSHEGMAARSRVGEIPLNYCCARHKDVRCYVFGKFESAKTILMFSTTVV